MSQENVESVHRAWAAANQGIEELLTCFPPDCVWHAFPEWPDVVGPRIGHEGIREIMSVWTDNFDGFAVTLLETRDLGDRVVGLGEQSATIKGSGVPIRQPMGQLCSDFRDGMPGDVRFFLTWREALEAGGLTN
jgi:ketosteroid isomerase-like protein